MNNACRQCSSSVHEGARTPVVMVMHISKFPESDFICSDTLRVVCITTEHNHVEFGVCDGEGRHCFHGSIMEKGLLYLISL